MKTPGTLYVVATPIGNLQDITFRAVEVLRAADVIACEDTRHTRKLLNHLGISAKLISYHEHNEAERADEIAAMLERGDSVAIVSDAGTPGVSDPGFRAVQKAIDVGAAVVPVPGPVAFVTALVASGLAGDAVFFGGFLPSRKTERRKRLRSVADIPATLVFYESPRRAGPSLTDALEILGDRQAVVAREITKLHEQFHRGTLSSLAKEFSLANSKGELVLLIGRATEAQKTTDLRPASIADRISELEADGADRKSALKQAAREFGISKSEAYRRLQTENK